MLNLKDNRLIHHIEKSGQCCERFSNDKRIEQWAKSVNVESEFTVRNISSPQQVDSQRAQRI